MWNEPAHIIFLSFRVFDLQHRKLYVVSFFVQGCSIFILVWASMASSDNFIKDSSSTELNGELPQVQRVWLDPHYYYYWGCVAVLSGHISDLRWVSWEESTTLRTLEKQIQLSGESCFVISELPCVKPRRKHWGGEQVDQFNRHGKW